MGRVRAPGRYLRRVLARGDGRAEALAVLSGPGQVPGTSAPSATAFEDSGTSINNNNTNNNSNNDTNNIVTMIIRIIIIINLPRRDPEQAPRLRHATSHLLHGGHLLHHCSHPQFETCWHSRHNKQS